MIIMVIIMEIMGIIMIIRKYINKNIRLVHNKIKCL